MNRTINENSFISGQHGIAAGYVENLARFKAQITVYVVLQLSMWVSSGFPRFLLLSKNIPAGELAILNGPYV